MRRELSGRLYTFFYHKHKDYWTKINAYCYFVETCGPSYKVIHKNYIITYNTTRGEIIIVACDSCRLCTQACMYTYRGKEKNEYLNCSKRGGQQHQLNARAMKGGKITWDTGEQIHSLKKLLNNSTSREGNLFSSPPSAITQQNLDPHNISQIQLSSNTEDCSNATRVLKFHRSHEDWRRQ